MRDGVTGIKAMLSLVVGVIERRTAACNSGCMQLDDDRTIQMCHIVPQGMLLRLNVLLCNACVGAVLSRRHSSVIAQTHQGGCSGLKVLFLACKLIEDPCEVVGLASVAISVTLGVFWRSNGDCGARHSMDAVLLAPARHAVL